MPRFAANLSTLFTELPFLERFGAAAGAGFEAVEFMFPYAFPAKEIRARMDDHRLVVALHNLPAGDWDGGERGIACHADREEEFRAGVAQGIEYALALGVPHLHCLSGIAPPNVPQSEVHAVLVDNLRFAAAQCAQAGLLLLLEPINTFDVPGYVLSRPDQALALIDTVGADNVMLQFDIYHVQRMQGELAATLERCLPRVAHVQIADNPGRHEPGSGEIHFPYLFALMDRLGYAGWVGCEYLPAGDTLAGLQWRERLAAATALPQVQQNPT